MIGSIESHARIVLLILSSLVPHRYYDSLRFAIVDSQKVLNTHPVKGGFNRLPSYFNAIKVLYYTILSYVNSVVLAIAHFFHKVVFAIASFF